MKNWQKGRRTYSLRSGDEGVIPVYVSGRTGVPATTMTTMLGSGKGALKAPRYTDFADDEEVLSASVFVQPLECLEIVRQPHFSSSILLKENAFLSDEIDHSRRYETFDPNQEGINSQFACVELVGQKDPKNAPTKESSAACNLISLVKKSGNKKINIELDVDGIDDADLRITPKKYGRQ